MFEVTSEPDDHVGKCSPGQFECKYSHECIPMGWQCDGENDCGLLPSEADNATETGPKNGLNRLDTSDEDSIRCGDSNVCPLNHFRCANLISCISLDLLCDGKANCPDGSDELEFCGKCASGLFKRNCTYIVISTQET